jgi:hypothetical protein
MAQITTSAGTDADFEITLLDADGNRVTTYTAEDSLSGEIWAGDDQAVLLLPSVSWIDPAQGTIRLTIVGSQTALISPARYRVRIRINTTDDRVIDAWESWLEITASPGSATAPKVYCTYNDLVLVAPWLATEQTVNDQAGFAEQRGLAREWLDSIIHRSFLHGIRSTYLQGLLDTDKLIVTPQVVEITAKRAIGTICANILSGAPGEKESGYQRLSYRFLAEASALAMEFTAEVDTDGDGEPELIVHCGKASIRGNV